MASKQKAGTSFTGFTAEISGENQQKIRAEIRSCINWRNTTLEIEEIATWLNSKLRGWINYFSLYGTKSLRRTMIYQDMKMLKWKKRKHKIGLRAAIWKLAILQYSRTTLFYH